MNDDLRKLSDAVLYEDYLLYPYRPSSLKNQHRYPLGTLYPEPFCTAWEAGDASRLELECVISGGSRSSLEIEVRFMQFLKVEPAVRSVQVPALPIRALTQEPFSLRFR